MCKEVCDKMKSKNWKQFLENNETILRLKQSFRSEAHTLFPETVNKISLSTNDNKRMQILKRITTYSYDYGW